MSPIRVKTIKVQSLKTAWTYAWAGVNTGMAHKNGTMSADIFKHKMAHAFQLKWTFLALKWAVFVLKLCPIFQDSNPNK